MQQDLPPWPPLGLAGLAGPSVPKIPKKIHQIAQNKQEKIVKKNIFGKKIAPPQKKNSLLRGTWKFLPIYLCSGS
jgi:hypothetical protein